MPGFASLSVASALKVASLNLCTDEYLLLLARPGRDRQRHAPGPGSGGIAAVAAGARLSRQSRVGRAGDRGAAHPAADDGRQRAIEQRSWRGGWGCGHSTCPMRRRSPMWRPTCGGSRRHWAMPRRADPWLRRLAALQRSASRDSAMRSSCRAAAIACRRDRRRCNGSRWRGLSSAALPGGRATLETLLVAPPAVLVRSDYRRGQMSQGMRWFDHPIVKRLEQRTIDDRRPRLDVRRAADGG